MLRARRQRSSFCDHSENATAQNNIEQGGLVARLQPGGWIAFDRLRLQDFTQVKLSGWPQGNAPLKVRIFASEQELSHQDLPPGPASEQPKVLMFPMPPVSDDAAPQQVRVQLDAPAGSLLEVMWAEFLQS